MSWFGAGAWEVLRFVLVLGVLIVFHEFGHYLAARLIGVRVEVFSFGFGSRLFGWRRGPTDYRVSLVPLGGYVRMAGDGIEHDATGLPHELESRKPWEKLVIMGAGPAFNLVLAFGLLAMAFMLGVEVPSWFKSPVQVEVVEKGSPGEAAGILPGDVITRVDGRPMPDWEHFNEIVVVSPGRTLDVTYERGGSEHAAELNVAERTEHALGWSGLSPCFAIVVRSVVKGGPAAAAELADGDALVSAGGEKTCTAEGFTEAIQAAAGTPLRVVLRRNGQEIERTLTARRKSEDARWLLGLTLGTTTGERVVEKYSLSRALGASFEQNVRQTRLLIRTVGALLTAQISVRTMSGPLELADITSETADAGFVPLLQLMALISLNLGVLNLVPIPILDGGRMVMIAFEAVRGRVFERRTKEWILQAGLVMIVALMAVVLYFDVIKKLGS